jgi:hypothetical protein
MPVTVGQGVGVGEADIYSQPLWVKGLAIAYLGAKPDIP